MRTRRLAFGLPRLFEYSRTRTGTHRSGRAAKPTLGSRFMNDRVVLQCRSATRLPVGGPPKYHSLRVERNEKGPRTAQTAFCQRTVKRGGCADRASCPGPSNKPKARRCDPPIRSRREGARPVGMPGPLRATNQSIARNPTPENLAGQGSGSAKAQLQTLHWPPRGCSRVP